jgi:hypothetical protein
MLNSKPISEEKKMKEKKVTKTHSVPKHHTITKSFLRKPPPSFQTSNFHSRLNRKNKISKHLKGNGIKKKN